MGSCGNVKQPRLLSRPWLACSLQTDIREKYPHNSLNMKESNCLGDQESHTRYTRDQGKTKYYWFLRNYSVNKITPSDILLHSWISVLFNHYQRIFLLHNTGTNAETHCQTLFRQRHPLNTQHSMGCLHQIPPVRTQGTSQKSRWKQYRIKGYRDSRTTGHSESDDQGLCKLTVTKEASTDQHTFITGHPHI